MSTSGHGDVPLLSWDSLLDGSGADQGFYIQRLGPAGVGSYASHATLPVSKASFVDSYRRAYGTDPDEYAAGAYACVEVIVDSLRAIAAATDRPDASSLREALRAYATDPDHHFPTVLGSVSFDANGDAVQQFVTFYRVDPSAAKGKGDWVVSKTQDYGPPP